MSVRTVLERGPKDKKFVAYAVDFSNGTIYLPPSHRSAVDLEDLRQVRFDAKAGAAERRNR